MSESKSNVIVPVIVAVIAVIGSITVALINNANKESSAQVRISRDSIQNINPQDANPDFPMFHNLSTFCDTLNYFLDQNSKQYSWLKAGKSLSTKENTVNYASKLNLLGYHTIIEQDKDGFDACIDVISTNDSLEAARLRDGLIDKFILCIDEHTSRSYGERPKTNMTVITNEFTIGLNQIALSFYSIYPENPENKAYFAVDFYIQTAK